MEKRLEKWFDGRKWEELNCFQVDGVKCALHVWWNDGGYENPDVYMTRVPGKGKLYALYNGEDIYEVGISPDERYWNECRDVYQLTPYQKLMMSGDGDGIFEEEIEKVEEEVIEELRDLIWNPSLKDVDIVIGFIDAIRVHIGGYVDDDEMFRLIKNIINNN